MQGGTVSGRVALLLRSAEVKPYLCRFVQQLLDLFHALCSGLVTGWAAAQGHAEVFMTFVGGGGLGQYPRP